MAPRKHHNTDNPDWPFIREAIEDALVAYDNWRRGLPPANNHDDDDLVAMLGEALIDAADHLRIDVLTYGKASS